MQTSFILDTNAAIYLKKGGLSAQTAQIVQRAITPVACLSVISKIELLGFRFPDPAEQQEMESFIGGSLILPITDAVVDQTILLRRLHRIKLPDLLIAATALVHNLTLVTRNTKDFTAIDGLLIVNPFAPTP
jgi:predicted nucleic acid-binding protein